MSDSQRLFRGGTSTTTSPTIDMPETLLSVLCSEPWRWDSFASSEITFNPDGTGELTCRAELNIWIAAEIEWKAQNTASLQQQISTSQQDAAASLAAGPIEIELTLTKLQHPAKMTKLSNLFATALFVSNVIAQKGNGSPGGNQQASGGSNKDIEASCSTPECFQGKKLSYYFVYSPECTGRERHTEEVCLGSDAWCSHSGRAKLYGSKAKCLELRPKPQSKAPWLPRSKAPCSDESEKCLGTDDACSSIENEVLVAEAVEMDLDVFRKLCLQQRSKEGAADPPEQGPSPPKETPKPPAASPKPPAQPETPSFQLPDSEGCSKPGADEEPCLGSIAWCDKHGHGDKNACLLTRGLDVKAFEETFQGLIAPVKQGILTWAQNVTKNAALREILFNSTKEAAQKSITTDLSGYMDKVQGSLGKQALEGLRKGLEKYAGQKLF
ncbi:hypothetical protein MY3296_006006 [Beauveria thailandica]